MTQRDEWEFRKTLSRKLGEVGYTLIEDSEGMYGEFVDHFMIPEIASNTKESDELAESLGLDLSIPGSEGTLLRIQSIRISTSEDLVYIVPVGVESEIPFTRDELLRALSQLESFWDVVKRRSEGLALVERLRGRTKS